MASEATAFLFEHETQRLHSGCLRHRQRFQHATVLLRASRWVQDDRFLPERHQPEYPVRVHEMVGK